MKNILLLFKGNLHNYNQNQNAKPERGSCANIRLLCRPLFHPPPTWLVKQNTPFPYVCIQGENLPKKHLLLPKNQCPFLHEGELGRRDLLRHKYSCVPCLEFKNGFCPQAEACGHAHGILEERFHPMLFRTRLRWYVTTCKRQDCSYAPKEEEKRAPTVAPFVPSLSSFRPSKSISTAALSIGVKSPVTIYPTHSMMQTLWQKQSSDYKEQQSQVQQRQQRPAIVYNRPSPSPQSFCGTNAGENDQFQTLNGLSGEKENFYHNQPPQ